MLVTLVTRDLYDGCVKTKRWKLNVFDVTLPDTFAAHSSSWVREIQGRMQSEVVSVAKSRDADVVPRAVVFVLVTLFTSCQEWRNYRIHILS